MCLEKRQQVLYKKQFFFSITLFLIAGISTLVGAITDCSAVQTQQLVVAPKTELEQPTSPLLPASLTALPLSFESNQGQTAVGNKFLARGPGYTLFLSAEQAVFRLKSGSPQDSESTDLLSIQSEQKVERVDDILQMQIVNANPNAVAEKLEPLPGTINYFTGNDPDLWRRNIPTHARLRYNEVYPGIDLEYYGHQGQLEYDFVVTPGNDPSQIRLAFEGVDDMEIAENGDLLLHTSHGTLRQKAPYSYQEKNGKRQVVPSHFVYYENPANNNSPAQKYIGFQLASYDTGQPLIIDPALSYSSYFGGTSNDSAYSVATDSAGNIYITGSTRSSNLPTVTPYQAANAGQTDIFISKLSADGSTLLYSTYLGGSSYEYPKDIAVDSSGAAYVIGHTRSSDFPVSTGAIQETFGGGSYDVYVAKLSAAGNSLEYATYLGGSNSDYGEGIAVNGSGEAFVTGHALSTDFPTYNALYSQIQGASDAFVAQLNTTGTALIYSTYLGGTSSDAAYDIAIDSSGNAYITGYTYSGYGFPVTTGAYSGTGSSYDVFVSKIGAGGSPLIYSTVFGGASSDYAYGLDVDGSGQVYVTGKTASSDFPTVGAYQTHGGGLDAFLVQVNTSGSDLLYSTYIGSPEEDIAYAVAVDTLGAVFITGSTRSADFPIKQPFLKGSTYGGGDYDSFVSRFDLSQTGEESLKYSIFLGGLANDFGYALSSPAPGVCYVVGSTYSTNFPLVNPLQVSPSGSTYDVAFIAKISDDQVYADLSILIEDLPDPVEVAHDYSYQVHVTNLGSGTASDVQLTHTLPVEISFISTNATQGTPVYNSGVVTLDIGTINYSETVTLSITVTAPAADTALTSTAQVTATSADSNLTNNSVIEETLVRSEYRYFEMAVYPDDYPCGTVISTPAGIDCGFASSICDADFLVDTPITLTASYNPNTCRFSSWKDANIGYQYGDELTITNSPWVRATFYAIDADLALSIENPNDFSLVSGIVEYHLTIDNVGTDKAETLVLIDALPAEAVYVSSNTSSGSCNYDNTAHQLTCNIYELARAQQVNITITVTALATPGTMTNQATVSNSVHELDLTNNSVTGITTVTDQPYTLIVSSIGEGTGVVSSDTIGIDCGSDCSEIYPEGKTVVLSAAPERGSFFIGWSGDGCSGMGSCVLVLDADKTISANFTTIPPPIIALPKTGQTSCFDDTGTVIDCTGTGQDGDIQAGIPWPDPRFEITYCDAAGPCSDQSTDCDGDTNTDMIIDHLTGLTWSRNFNLGGYTTWQQAFDTVSNINTTTGLGGHSDWRIPNVNELASIVLHQKEGSYTSTWLVSQGFVGPYNATVWGATTVPAEYYEQRVFNGFLQFGTVEGGYKSQTYGVWVVRGTSSGPAPVRKTGQILCFDTDGKIINCAGTGQDGDIQAGADWPDPAPRFSVIYCNGSGECADQSTDCDSDESTDMVRDNLTGLLLARDANLTGNYGNMQVSRDALSAVNSGGGLGGHTDWRMPNVYELLSLAESSGKPSFLPEGHPFVDVQYTYWSSTSINRSLMPGNRAYFVDFNLGSSDEQDKVTGGAYLWLIREDTGTADLHVTLADSSDPVRVNGSLTYTIDILNNGPGVATDVILINTLPPEVSFVSVNSSQGSCSHSTGEVSCTMDAIDRNSVSTVSIEVSVGTELITVENSVTVTTSKDEFNTADNTAVETTRISDTDYTLTVNSGGTGSGNITSNPVGIDCDSSCSHLYFEASPVMLTAIADGSSLFMGWDGCDQVTGSQCTVTVATDLTVTALFDAVTTADYYVASAGDDSNSGYGWSRPFQTIDKALSVAESGDEIWVKAGTYQPPIVNESLKTSNFTLEKGVSLYGGFDGSETVRHQRNWEVNKTTIDSGRSGYNSQGFFVNTGTGVQARIDGFVIRGGWAFGDFPFHTGGGIIVYSGSPIIANCDIKFNYAAHNGGGIAAGSGTTIINSRIHHNNAASYGGGIVGTSGVQVINSAVYSNYTTYSGGGIAFWGGGSIESTTVTNNTVSSGSEGVAGVHGYEQGTTTINNSIVWGNSKGDNPSEIALNTNATAVVSYSNIRGGYSGTGNIDTDPGFFDVSEGDLKVQPYSATIDTGNTANLATDSADLDGDGDTIEPLPWDLVKNSRVIATTVDMGAYEYDPEHYTEYPVSVTVNPSGAATVSGPGMNCSTSCSADYYADSQLTLTAVPQSPYRFAYWEGCDSSSWDRCMVTVDTVKAITSHLVHEEADGDSDGMLDWWEYYYFHSLARNGSGDYDGDGLSDEDEETWGTHPNESDTDDDGMPDGWEVSYNLQPLSDDADQDADNDGLTNLEEYELGTNPRLEDTDSDGMPDAWEDDVGLDPTDNDATGDADGDGISNLDEYLNGTNPTPLCGDVSDDSVIDLSDLILVLQVLTGTSSNSHFNGDCNSDGKIGMNEGLFILQKVADD